VLSAEEAHPRYQAVLARLAARGRFGIRLGLGRTRALLRQMGDPQLGLPGVLIGGTNGKGSTQAMVASVLREAGLRVGQTPKPHLVSYRERIVVDGAPIGVAEFVDLISAVLDAADAVAGGHGPPTEFEVITAAAFSWFRRTGVEVGVVEVGLGGRLDATNAWQGGVSAITNVTLDHMEYLGDTVEAMVLGVDPGARRICSASCEMFYADRGSSTARPAVCLQHRAAAWHRIPASACCSRSSARRRDRRRRTDFHQAAANHR